MNLEEYENEIQITRKQLFELMKNAKEEGKEWTEVDEITKRWDKHNALCLEFHYKKHDFLIKGFMNYQTS